MNQLTSRKRPVARRMRVKLENPRARPLAMLYVSGMVIMVRNAGRRGWIGPVNRRGSGHHEAAHHNQGGGGSGRRNHSAERSNGQGDQEHQPGDDGGHSGSSAGRNSRGAFDVADNCRGAG